MSSDARALCDYMSELSEAGWHAGWMQDLEYELWSALQSGIAYRLGQLDLSPEQLDRLRDLATSAGGWIRWDEGSEQEVFVAMDDWRSHVERRGR